MKQDQIKSCVLIFLIGLNVFLAGSILSKMYKEDTQALDNNININDIKLDITDYMNPQNFTISFGGNDYSVFYSEPFQNVQYPEDKPLIIWDIARKELKEYFRGVYEYESISKEDYDKSKQFKSISLQLGYEVSANEFISIISGLDERDRELSDRIDTILIPATANQKNNIYLTNSKGSKYIKFTGNDKTDNILMLINSLKEVSDKNIIYRSLKDALGNTENDTIAPFIPTSEENKFNLPYFLSEGIVLEDNAAITTYAYSFFANDLSFTKEIAETDGTIIYMYGYGDKVLRINKDGLVEYFENEPRSSDDNSSEFEASLKRAVYFISNKVGFPYDKNEIYLSNYEYDEKDGKHKFAFSYRINGYQVGMLLGRDDKLFEVEIKNNTVTYYKSLIKTAGPSIINKDGSIIGFLDVIRNNIELIRNNYYKSKGIDPENMLEDKFPITDHINDVMLAYYLVGDEFKPAWKIGIDDIVYYFDIYDGFNYTYYKSQTSGDKNELE